MRAAVLMLPLCLCVAIAMADGVPSPRPLLIEEVERILSVPAGTEDPLPAIENSLASAKKGDTRSSLEKLSDAIIRSRPAALREATLNKATLDMRSTSQLPPYQWSQGTYPEREQLRRLMWTAAKTNAKSDPKLAKKLALATIIFESMDDFPMGSSSLPYFLEDQQGVEAAELNDKQLKDLKDLVPKFGPVQADNWTHRTAGIQIDRLFKHPTSEEFGLAIKYLEESFKVISTDYEQYQFARDVVQLSNHAKKSQNAEIIAHVNEVKQKWTAATTGRFRKWMEEAMKAEAEPARDYNIAVYKDGKWVDTDTDGVPLK